MKKHLLNLLIFSLTTPQVLAQGWQPAGARSNAMGNASVTLTDVWSYHHNPGALGELESFTFGASYENRFLLKELQSQSIAMAIPIKHGVVSVGGQMTGFKLFRTQKVGLGYSLQLTDKLFAGIQLNYLGVQLPETYGNKNNLTAEAGIKAYLSENWSIGMSVFNIGRTRLGSFEDDRLTTLIRLGSGYTLSKKVKLTVEAFKHLEYTLQGKVGMEYMPIEKFYLRMGVSTNPMEFCFGFGYRWKKLQIDMASTFHSILGWSPGFTLSFINN